MDMKRAYSTLEIKASEDSSGKRKFTGIASTPSVDSMGDIVEPAGMEITLPTPLLWQHDSNQPIGWIKSVKVSKKGIEVECEIHNEPTPGRLKDRLDEAWQCLKSGLVRGLSIGFNVVEHAHIEGTYGYRFIKTILKELSAVTIPANQDCGLTAIKAADQRFLRANGHQKGVLRLQPSTKGTVPGVTGNKPTATPKGTEMKSIAEQIAAFQTKRAESLDKTVKIMEKSAEEGRSLDESEKEEYEGAKAEIKEADDHIARLKEHESLMVQRAAAVDASAGTGKATPGTGMVVRGAGAVDVRGNVLTVRPVVAKGTAFTRFACAMMNAKGNVMQAAEIAKRWDDSTPEVGLMLKAAISTGSVDFVTKTAVAAGTTSDATWAGPLVQYNDMVGEFIDLLRNETILGKLTKLRRVPFNVRIPRQTAGTTGQFVGEGAPAPVNKLDFDNITIPWAKCATIVVITKELAMLSDPSAEALVRNDLIAGTAEYLDKRFIDPSFAGVANVSPASVTWGVAPISSSGVTLAAITTDAQAMIRQFVSNRLSLRSGVWIMSPELALVLSMQRGTQSNFVFPDINVNGGTFFGMPVITSKSVIAGGSPTDQHLILLDQDEIFLADRGEVNLDSSAEASVQMNDAPSAGAQSLVSLWQNGLLGVKIERWIYWAKRRASAVAIMDNVNYA